MCSVCYGIGHCPVCSPDEEPDFEQLLDEELNQADDLNQCEKDNKK